MVALLLTAWLFMPQQGGATRPVFLSGDMRADWTNHAATAEVCVVDEMPAKHILVSWRKLGVKMLKRVAWTPECSPEYVRRKAGFLAVREGADGVWLVDEDKFTATWKTAVTEAETDADVALYCKSLAEKAMAYREKDNKVWIEGRRVLWLFQFMDFDSEDLDTLRLEFASYAKRLEQLLGIAPRNLPMSAGKPLSADRAPFEPLADKKVTPKAVKLVAKAPVALSDALTFVSDSGGFGFKLVSRKKFEGRWPNEKGTFRLYLADGKGSYLPYEFRIDLSAVATNRAPTDAKGLWQLEERWSKGGLGTDDSKSSRRLASVAYGSYGSHYPRLVPRFDFKGEKDGSGWTLKLDFSWLSAWGFWPAMKNGRADKWYVAVDGFSGVSDVACRLDWEKGAAGNFNGIAAGVSRQAIVEEHEKQVEKVKGSYRLWRKDRRYEFAKTKVPTFQRCDLESDKVFWERIVAPAIEANENIVKKVPATLDKVDASRRASAVKSVGGVFTLSERLSAARRDYILQRLSGGMPSEPKAKPKAEAPGESGVDEGEEGVQLDEEVL